jgi:hypothetical protein
MTKKLNIWKKHVINGTFYGENKSAWERTPKGEEEGIFYGEIKPAWQRTPEGEKQGNFYGEIRPRWQMPFNLGEK